jgi:hypothetical protein
VDLREERAFAEVRLRDRREAAVRALLGRIVILLPYFDDVPGLSIAHDALAVLALP